MAGIRLAACSTNESGAWFDALPSSNLGTLLDDETFRIAYCLRFGMDICVAHKCRCGVTVDSKGLPCKRSPGRFPRYAEINAIISRALRSIHVPCILEPNNLTQPTDINRKKAPHKYWI
ncbi:hypothetical protein ACOME3_010360 [Neoechinorhynchus agilis]